LKHFLVAFALTSSLASAALTPWDVRSLRQGDPQAGLLKIAADTSEAAGFLKVELTARKGDPKAARGLARTFLKTRPGSVLTFRARSLEAWSALELGEYHDAFDLLASVAGGSDAAAARDARASLAEWVGQKGVPAAELLRLSSLVDDGPDTLQTALVNAFAKRAGASAKGPVVVVLPQTGDFGAIGRRVTLGARIALEKAGAEVVVLDEPADPVEVSRLVRGVLKTCHPRAIVGPLLSAAATIAAQEVARMSPETPLVLPAATSPGIAGLSPAAAQINLTTEAQGRAAARLAHDCLKASEAWILHPRGDYGDAVADGFRQEFERLGGRVAWQQSWPAGRTDFRGQLESLRKAAVDLATLRGTDSTRPSPLVFAPCENATEAASLGSQARALPMSPSWVGASGWHSRQFLTEAAGRLDGAYLVTDRIPDERRPGWKTLVASWKSKDPPDPLAALGYDAGLVVLLGHLPVAPEVLAGAAGDISLDPKGRYNLLAPTLRIDKGAFAESNCPNNR